jgi:type II secretory pathway pseudopilin PulG
MLTPARQPRPSPRGFTVLEMLVTIGLIMLLMAIAVVALNAVLGNNQRQATIAYTQRLKTSLAEVESNATARSRFYEDLIWRAHSPDNTGTPYLPSDPTASSPLVWASLDVTQLSSSTLTNQPSRINFAHHAMKPTIFVLRMMTSSSAIRDSLGTLPSRNRGDVPAAMQEAFFGRTTPNPPVPAQPDGLDLVKISLDAWGTPIVFVADGFLYRDPRTSTAIPAAAWGGVTGVYSVSRNMFWAGSRPSVLPNTATSGGTVFRAPDRKPFFMSAGPDRDFATLDDNLFSFDN